MEKYYNCCYPTLQELIKNKNRNLFPDIENIDNKRDINDQSVLLGFFKSYNGILCDYLFNDEYCSDEYVVYFKEWANIDKNIKNGITVVIK